jgi:hypothetical protein
MTAKQVTAASSCCQDLLLCLQGGFGNKNVRVCMVDTGFDYFHPDLAQNLWSNPGEIPNNGKDDDNDGVPFHSDALWPRESPLPMASTLKCTSCYIARCCGRCAWRQLRPGDEERRSIR